MLVHCKVEEVVPSINVAEEQSRGERVKTNVTLDMDRKESTKGCVSLCVSDIDVNLEDLIVENNSHVKEYE